MTILTCKCEAHQTKAQDQTHLFPDPTLAVKSIWFMLQRWAFQSVDACASSLKSLALGATLLCMGKNRMSYSCSNISMAIHCQEHDRAIAAAGKVVTNVHMTACAYVIWMNACNVSSSLRRFNLLSHQS